MKCTISGSFRKFYEKICEAYDIFEQNGITVLSPKKSKIINPGEKFAILESDPNNSTEKELEDKHTDSIKESDFLYIVNPNGYIGDSVKYEIGYARAFDKSIYSSDPIVDIPFKFYISKVLSTKELVDFLERKN